MISILRVIVITMVCLLMTLCYVSADNEVGNESRIPCTDCGMKAGDLTLLDILQISTGPGFSSVTGEEIDENWTFFCDENGYDTGYTGDYTGGFIGTGTAGGSGIPIDILISGLTSLPGWNNPRTNFPKKNVYTPPVSAHPDTYITMPLPGGCNKLGICDCTGYQIKCQGYTGYEKGSQWSRSCCGYFPWTGRF